MIRVLSIFLFLSFISIPVKAEGVGSCFALVGFQDRLSVVVQNRVRGTGKIIKIQVREPDSQRLEAEVIARAYKEYDDYVMHININTKNSALKGSVAVGMVLDRFLEEGFPVNVVKTQWSLVPVALNGQSDNYNSFKEGFKSALESMSEAPHQVSTLSRSSMVQAILEGAKNTWSDYIFTSKFDFNLADSRVVFQEEEGGGIEVLSEYRKGQPPGEGPTAYYDLRAMSYLLHEIYPELSPNELLEMQK
ncbi:MAG: hypothetical protein KDD22_02850 [Bdellovibrionales bacterium]|nr:hypothetical protein [Bdellovibrionales bacterium]